MINEKGEVEKRMVPLGKVTMRTTSAFELKKKKPKPHGGC